MAGLARARGAYAITMDDDLQNPPGEVKRLFEHARDGDYDAVYTYYAEKQHAAWRNLGSRFTNWCADRLIDKPPGLYLSSFRCISAFVRERITASYEGPYPYVDGLVFQVTQNVGRLQVEHLPRVEGRSNYTLRRLIRLWLSMFLNFSVMPLRLRHAVRPGLRRAGGAGRRHRRRRGDHLGQAAARLGVADGGGAGAGRRAARRRRADRRVSRPHVPRRQPQAAVSRARGLSARRRRVARSSGPKSTRARRASRTANHLDGSPDDDGLLRGAGHRHPGRHRRTDAAQGRRRRPGLRRASCCGRRRLAGLALYGSAAFLYIIALRKIPVSVAFPSVSLSYAIVAVLGHFLFGEPFGIKQIGGIVAHHGRRRADQSGMRSSTVTYEQIKYEAKDGILTITLEPAGQAQRLHRQDAVGAARRHGPRRPRRRRARRGLHRRRPRLLRRRRPVGRRQHLQCRESRPGRSRPRRPSRRRRPVHPAPLRSR